MTTQTEALRLALDALVSMCPVTEKEKAAVAACKEALAAPQGDCNCADQLDCDGQCCIKAAPQVEPFAWVTKLGILLPPYEPMPDDVPLYTHPAPAPLSEAEVGDLTLDELRNLATAWHDAYARAVERHVRGV